MVETSLNHRKEMEAGPGRKFLKQLAETLELVLDAYHIYSIVSRSSKSFFFNYIVWFAFNGD